MAALSLGTYVRSFVECHKVTPWDIYQHRQLYLLPSFSSSARNNEPLLLGSSWRITTAQFTSQDVPLTQGKCEHPCHTWGAAVSTPSSLCLSAVSGTLLVHGLETVQAKVISVGHWWSRTARRPNLTNNSLCASLPWLWEERYPFPHPSPMEN